MARKSGEQSPIPADPAEMGRFKQIRMVAGIVRKQNPKALPLCAAAAVGTAAVLILIGFLTGLVWGFVPLAILAAVLVGMVLFGRFATATQYKMVEGQPGAAAAILQSLRGGFTTTPGIAANRNMDVVHRTVGKPGVILVGEGSPTRLPSLLAAEKRRISRVASQIPIYDFQVGDAAGQIPIKELNRKIMKLPRNLKGQAVAELNFRLNALPSQLQMPKGPVPRSARMPKPPRPRVR